MTGVTATQNLQFHTPNCMEPQLLWISMLRFSSNRPERSAAQGMCLPTTASAFLKHFYQEHACGIYTEFLLLC